MRPPIRSLVLVFPLLVLGSLASAALLDAPADNIFVLKVSYWLGL